MSKLNEDIFFLIFEELQDDSKSLFSCLMVNRLWCEIIIPILWRNPWCYEINYSNKNYLFAIIASYLSDDIKESLTSQGIRLPSFSHQSLLFDYLSFCRNVNICIINSLISIGSPSENDHSFLQREFYGLFMKRCSRLKYLDMIPIEHQIFYFPEAKLSLKSLYELKCNASFSSSHFYELTGLEGISKYIQRLIIVNVDQKSYHGIAKLIKVQKNLKYFEWIDDYGIYGDLEVDPYKEIILALEKKANTINHLKIYFNHEVDHTLHFSHDVDDTLQKILSRFHKLKTLIINDFRYFNEEQLNKCAYRDLEIFKVDYYNLKAASIIIENSGGRLKKILLEPFDIYDYVDNFNENSFALIRKIYEICPLIEHLSLAFPILSMEHFTEFEKLLKICQNLKTLLLVVFHYEILTYERRLEYGERLLKVLNSSTSTNIKEIRFHGDLKFSLEALEEFLIKWKGCALFIITTTYIYNGDDDYMKMINKYKIMGVIKDYKSEFAINVMDLDFKI
jgi:hypothetical protein